MAARGDQPVVSRKVAVEWLQVNWFVGSGGALLMADHLSWAAETLSLVDISDIIVQYCIYLYIYLEPRVNNKPPSGLHNTLADVCCRWVGGTLADKC